MLFGDSLRLALMKLELNTCLTTCLKIVLIFSTRRDGSFDSSGSSVTFRDNPEWKLFDWWILLVDRTSS